ncbi:hypothetical protein A2Y85_04525 [candidate division WOR-3 bacterium RBG_13_43_14]|uniref:Tetratricopeptide repeat protein n=1 Tax=candidate division WOR-3 bacterium RBG_13_43_14 TaxID=1802590 RepID=A0A1F4U274_UNCW3|nr:MAG: hypothetical protein A2Y85_04525 [candidate division WOR-3 bacterium RBG_13_43_14]
MFDIFGGKDPQKALQKASEYTKEGRIDAAIKVLEGNLTDGEESFDLYMNLARLYFETGERPRSVAVLRSAKVVAPNRTDEVVALLSTLYYEHSSIDLGEYLLQLFIEQEHYDEISKVLRQLSDRDIKLMLTRYEKLKTAIEEKQVISKKDFENLLILAAARFYIDESEKAVQTVELLINAGAFSNQLYKWVQIVARERYNDVYASVLFLKVQLGRGEFEPALIQAQRILEKVPESVDLLITLIGSIKPSKELEASYTQFITELYVKKGDPELSVDLLLAAIKKDAKKSDEVIKGLRELERMNPGSLKVRFALGDTYLAANRISLAVAEYEKILESDPGQFAKVNERFQQAFSKEPNNPHLIEALVIANLQQNNIEGAADVIEAAYRVDVGLLDEYIINLNTILEKQLNNARALYLLGLCYARKGYHDNAVVVFDNLMENNQADYVRSATDELLKNNPDNIEYLKLWTSSLIVQDSVDEAFDRVLKYLNDNPDRTNDMVTLLDRICSKRPKRIKEIIALYENLQKTEPFITELATARAYGYAEQYDNSIALFEKLVADESRKEIAKKALIEVIKQCPQAVPLLLAAARIYMKDGEVEIATQFFKTAQMVDPKAFFEIIDEFYDALKNFPKDREVRVLLIDAFFSRKLWDRVIEEAKRGIDVFGRDAQFFNLKLGEALVESGNLSDAVRPLMLSLDGKADYAKEVTKYLDKILSIDKSNVPAHFARGRALSRAKRINEAVEEYLLTVRILPARAEYVNEELKSLATKSMANPLIIYALGNVEMVLKRFDEAIKHLLQACELDPGLVKRVIPIYEKLIQSSSSPLLDYSIAKAYHLAGLKSSAIKYYIKAQSSDKAYREPAISEMKNICAEDPNDIESMKGLAEIYFNYNNLEDSLELVQGVFKANKDESNWVKKFISSILHKKPDHIPSYYALSGIFIEEQTYNKSVDVYRKLIELSPGEITNVISNIDGIEKKEGVLMLFLGELYTDAGDVMKAVSIFEKLFDLDANFGDSIIHQIKEILKKNVNVGEAYLLAHRIFVYEKEYERALESLKHAQQILPDKEAIALLEGKLYYEMGEPERAIKLYTELLNSAKDRDSVYRLIKNTRKRYFEEKLNSIKGDGEVERLGRANMYLLIDKLGMAEKELQFAPATGFNAKQQAILRSRICLRRGRPLDALEIMKDLPIDDETAQVYADIYEVIGSYDAAASVLRNAGIKNVDQKIASYEKLAQEQRLIKGRFFIEGRS